jgi:anti-anti-sigma factor
MSPPPVVVHSSDTMLLIDFEQRGDVCFVRFRGRLSAGSDVEYLGAQCDRIKQLPAAKLLVDFGDVHSIGSTGIGFLVGLYTSASKKPGGRFVLVGVNSRVREVLDLTRLSAILPLASDVQAGLVLLGSSEAEAAAL